MTTETPIPFAPSELALILTFAFTTMDLFRQDPEKLEQALDPENGLTPELFEQVYQKLAMMRLLANIANLVKEPEESDDAGDDLASMTPAGHA